MVEERRHDRVGVKDLSLAAWRLTMLVYVAYLAAMVCGLFLAERVIWASALGGIALATIVLDALRTGELFAGARLVKMVEEPITFAVGILVTLGVSVLLSWMGILPWR